MVFNLLKTGLCFVFLFSSMELLAQDKQNAQNSKSKIEAEKEFIEEQSTGEVADQLAKDIQNPIASIMSIPFQNNTDFYEGTSMNTLNIQPVLPFRLSKNTNLITRTIIPITRVPDFVPVEDKSGIGNTFMSFMVTAAKPGKVIYGYGIATSLPASDVAFGSKQFGIGPSAVVLTQSNGWTLGGVFQNTWGITDAKGGPEMNLFYSQIFVVRNFSKGWYVNSAPIFTANWTASGGSRWSVPIGAGVGRLVRIGGKLPLNLQAGYYAYLVHPAEASGQLRLQATFILPILYQKK